MMPRHVIVQAGGKGTRMGKFTSNKPKCLISINGRPMLYSLGKAFEGSKLYIITDYKADVLESYLKTFPPDFDYVLVRSRGSGTCAGIKSAVDMLPSNTKFAIVWSDLYFDVPPKIPEMSLNYIGTTNKLTCRWRVDNGTLVEDRGNKNGVIGLFQFNDKSVINDVPKEGEFVKFLRDSNVPLRTVTIENVKEFGTIESYQEMFKNKMNSRFFNSVKVDGNTVIKTTIDKNFSQLLKDEITWYKFVMKNGYKNIPKIKSFSPLKMEFIKGRAPYRFGSEISVSERKRTLNSILNTLDNLHNIGEVPAKTNVLNDVYIKKTIQRINKVKQVIPENTTDYYIVNGQKVKNLLNPKYTGRIKELTNKITKAEKFSVIHGDPTFSNMIIEDKTQKVVLIDPRGYFGKLKIYGDPFYDYSKLYYSVIGNYDLFNSKDFEVKLNGKEIDIRINSSGWEETAKVFEDRFGEDMRTIKILHSLIWLSLAGWTDDLDSILGAYFNGLRIFEEAWNEYG